MIDYKKRAEVTSAQAQLFETAIKTMGDCPEDTDVLIWKAYREGMESQLKTLNKELDKYMKRSKHAKL